MARSQARQGSAQRIGVQQIGGDRLQSRKIRRPSCEALNLPAEAEQMTREIIANDAAGAHDERGVCHA